MMIAWIVFIILVSLVAGLLLTPFRMEIDSRQGIYQFRWSGLIRLNWLPEESLDVLEIRTFFFNKKIHLFATGSSPKKAPKKTAPQKRSKRILSPRRAFRLAVHLIKTFRVRRCRIDWDTDDYVLNAWLFPVFLVFGHRSTPLLINFSGQREIDLVVENTAGRLIWASVKSIMFT